MASDPIFCIKSNSSLSVGFCLHLGHLINLALLHFITLVLFSMYVQCNVSKLNINLKLYTVCSTQQVWIISNIYNLLCTLFQLFKILYCEIFQCLYKTKTFILLYSYASLWCSICNINKVVKHQKDLAYRWPKMAFLYNKASYGFFILFLN